MSTQDTTRKDEQVRDTFSAEQLAVFREISSGFDEWYRVNYDERARYVWMRLLALRRKDDTRGER